jgi:tetratricopeptide (TPR) repeat protein
MMDRPFPEPHLVLLVHGINTRARWFANMRDALSNAGFTVVPAGYGVYGILRFLLPFKLLRSNAKDRLRRKIEGARNLYQPSNVSVIAHSFGTRLIAELLAEQHNSKWDRLIFCGSVIPEDFDFALLFKRYSPPALNEIGTKDPWPALAQAATWDCGAIGSHGYQGAGVEERWHLGFKHSDFFTEEVCTKYWIPFLLRGEIVPGDKPVPLPVWIRLLARLPLRWLIPLLLVCAAFAPLTFCSSGCVTEVNAMWQALDSPSPNYSTARQIGESIKDCNSIQAFSGLGAADYYQRRYGSSVSNFEAAYDRRGWDKLSHDSNATIRMNLASAYFAIGRFDSAIKIYNEIRDRGPLWDYSMAWAKLASGNLDEAQRLAAGLPENFEEGGTLPGREQMLRAAIYFELASRRTGEEAAKLREEAANYYRKGYAAAPERWRQILFNGAKERTEDFTMLVDLVARNRSALP